MSGSAAGRVVFTFGSALSESRWGRIVLVLLTLFGLQQVVVSLISSRFDDAFMFGLLSLVPLAFALVGHLRQRARDGATRRRRRALGLGTVVLLGVIGALAVVVLLLRRRQRTEPLDLPALDPEEIDRLAKEEVAG